MANLGDSIISEFMPYHVMITVVLLAKNYRKNLSTATLLSDGSTEMMPMIPSPLVPEFLWSVDSTN